MHSHKKIYKYRVTVRRYTFTYADIHIVPFTGNAGNLVTGIRRSSSSELESD